METKKFQILFFLSLLFSVLILSLLLFLPFIAPICLAFMIAIVYKPAYRKMLKFFGGKRTLTALVSTVVIVSIITIPVYFTLEQLSVETYNLYLGMSKNNFAYLDNLSLKINDVARGIYPSFDFDLVTYINETLSKVADNVGKIFSSTASVILNVFLFIIALFYVLRDGRNFRDGLISLSPLPDKYDNQIMDKLEHAVNYVIFGTFLISVIQGVLVSLGFYIFGLSNVFLWGVVAAMSSFLPGIGTGMVIIPAVIYLMAISSFGGAIGLALWGIVIVGLIDNIVLPIIVSKGFTVHPVFILFSIIGGVIFFGPVGLFVGPLIIALLFALTDIYKILILDDQYRKITSI